ncbi:MAG: hypothetical protein JW963_02365 [Anaerolineales bacterium]|nr:hypothetical protein [Anaerolineales bacterium]
MILGVGWGDYIEKYHLAMLNMETLEVRNFCIPYDWWSGTLLAWAPNSQQLILEVGIGQETDYFSGVILVDTLGGWAAKIAEEMKPVGWMKPPP